MHRRENHHCMRAWFKEINKLAEKHPNLEFILPLHPNPNVQTHKGLLHKIRVVTPLSHHDLISLLVKCRLVISDSGGLQEEASFFNKKVIVCRKVTERPEGIETGHLHLCDSPDQLGKLFDRLCDNYYIDNPCPYGDGHSSTRISKLL